MRDRTLEDTFYVLFTTRAFATGIPTVLAGTPVVSAYEDDSVTQITAGITLGVDHDGVVGLNLLTIVATAANGYETDKEYSLVLTAGTVGGVSVVGEVVGEFSIGKAAAVAVLGDGTDGLTAIKNAIDVIDGILDTLNLGIITGAAATGTLSTTQATTDLTGYADDQIIGATIIWTSGAAEGERQDIQDYENTNGLITFGQLTTAPSDGDTFKIV